MLDFIKKHHRVFFYSAWIILALVQASFTELQDDEAYYWVYSKFLAWGYFDHPPMTALLIKTGTIFGNHEITVRLLFVLLNVLTLYITEKLIAKKDSALFYVICLSLGIMHLAGFFAVPDVPLIFFTALLFLVYKQYLQRPTWSNAFLIALVIACLLYSKYHGVLIIFFILLSNPKLLFDKKIYASGIIAFFLYIPHILWQYNHHWVTLQYQLFERSSGGYDITYTTDYILGQILLAGPLCGFVLLPAAFLFKTSDLLQRALRFSAAGLLLFFLFSSFKGRVEANWTAPALISIIVLAHQYLLDHMQWRKWLLRLFPFSIAIILVFRVITIINVIPAEPITERYFAWKKWPSVLKGKTNNLPVVFNSNYQRASKYWFYSGQVSYSLNSYRERQNNYNFWPIEDSILGRPVYYMDIYKTDSFPNTIETPLWKIGYGPDTNYYSFNKIEIISDRYSISVHKNDPVTINITATVPPHYFNFLKQHPEINPPILIGALKNTFIVKDFPIQIKLRDLLHNKTLRTSISADLEPGTYSIYFAVQSSVGVYTRNSERIKLVVQ